MADRQVQVAAEVRPRGREAAIALQDDIALHARLVMERQAAADRHLAHLALHAGAKGQRACRTDSQGRRENIFRQTLAQGYVAGLAGDAAARQADVGALLHRLGTEVEA